VDESGGGAIKAVPLNDKQDIQVVKEIAGDKYDQAGFLKAMRGAATPQDAIKAIDDKELREKFARAGNIIFSSDTVAALKPPRKRAPAGKKPAAAVTDSPAAPPAVAFAPKPKQPDKPAARPAKRKAEPAAAASPRKAAKVETAAAAGAPPRLRVTVTAEVSSMAEFAELLKCQDL
jgi:hypothetical protein